MKFTLRFTLTSILLTVIILTVAALGSNSYRNARFIADDFSAQILDSTSLQVDNQINGLLLTATEQGRLNRGLLQSGQYDIHDFPRFARYWLNVMAANRRLTRLSLGLDSGEWFYVRRLLDGKPAIGELRRNAKTGKLELSAYWPENYPHKRFYFSADKSDEDPRDRSWYLAAQAAGRQTWSETYVLFGIEGVADVPGVSRATPIYAANGSLRGVLTSSFDLIELCKYLKDLRVGKHGYAFVVEFRADGSRRLIAHPDPAILLRAVPGHGSRDLRELVPSDELSDRLVAAFVRNLPADLNPTALTETTRLKFVDDGVPYLGAYHCLTTRETPDWLVCTILPESDVLHSVERSNQEALGIGMVVLLAATLVSLYVSRKVAQPLERLAHETEAIGSLQLEARPVAHSPVKEVDRLALTVEDTKTSLRSFQKYVPADLVRLLLSSGQEAKLGGEVRTVTVYFCDLVNFTAVSERLSAEDLVRHLSDYFSTFSAQILGTDGTVDKYIGDAIMAFWGAPSTNPRHALAACTAALQNQAALKDLRRRWQAEGKPLLFARIGIHTGAVVVGNIGSAARLNYTVMGDTVNLASRLEGLNKHYGTEVLISEHTYREAQGSVVARPVDWVSVKGKTQSVLIYELVGLKDQVPKGSDQLAELYGQALDLYRRRRDWAGASRLFEEALRLRPDDGPAQLLIARCRAYQGEAPPEDWDGVHRMDSK